MLNVKNVKERVSIFDGYLISYPMAKYLQSRNESCGSRILLLACPSYIVQVDLIGSKVLLSILCMLCEITTDR